MDSIHSSAILELKQGLGGWVLKLWAPIPISGITGTPQLLTKKFLLTYREKERQGKMGKKEGKSKKGRWKIEIEGGEWQNEEGTFFSLFLSFLFTFQNDLNLFLVYRNGNFYQETAFHAGKKSGKMTFPPQKNFPLTPLIPMFQNWHKQAV